MLQPNNNTVYTAALYCRLSKDDGFSDRDSSSIETQRTLLTNYWRSKRQLEVFSWTPLSDTTVYDRLNAFLEGAKGTITEPKQLLGDFGLLVGGFFYRDTDRFMQWCCEHSDSQLTKGMVSHYKEVSPEWLLDQLKRIKDPQILTRSKQLLGL